ncbi:MAG TPA: hypothetical protein VNO17_06860, partial [Actinomycetota bacterium]|nr:hypothetical protein [Actinomycetota bacterium]
MEERRCPTCGALVARDAGWCGQCFSPLGGSAAPQGGARAAAPAPTEVPQARSTSRRAPAAWPCPVCDHRNPIEAEVCAVCGTPFARLFDRR